MSFIYENPWLLQELLKSAQATPAPAPAQNTNKPASAPTEEDSKALEYAKQLVQNLYKELEGGFTFTAERDNADLSAAHVVNVDELLNFLQFNGVKANGRDLVMKANVFLDQNGKLKPEMTELSKWYVPYPVQGNANYYLYKDGMIGFLKDLEEKAVNNPMLKVIVTKLKATLSTALPEKVTPQTEAAGDSTTPQVNPQQAGQAGQAGGLSAASPQILMQLSSLRPFNSQFISLQEISKFLELYEQYANDPNVAQMISKLKFSIQKFKDETQMGSDTIQLYNLTTSQFRGMLKNPNDAYRVAALLYDVVFYGGQLYQRLVTSLQTIANDPERGKYIDYRAMQQQVTPGGPQLTNVNDINELMYMFKQEWNQK